MWGFQALEAGPRASKPLLVTLPAAGGAQAGAACHQNPPLQKPGEVTTLSGLFPGDPAPTAHCPSLSTGGLGCGRDSAGLQPGHAREGGHCP